MARLSAAIGERRATATVMIQALQAPRAVVGSSPRGSLLSDAPARDVHRSRTIRHDIR
jgi:hypothetical protein